MRYRCGDKQFDVVSNGFGSPLLSKDGKDTSPEGGNVRKLIISRQSRQLSLCCCFFVKVLFPNCTLTWTANKYFERQGRCVERRNEGT